MHKILRAPIGVGAAVATITVLLVSNPAIAGSDKSEPDMAPYMNLLKAKIQKEWRAPNADRNCSVSVLFTIGRNGELLSNSIKKGSGFPNIDKLALQTIKKCAPFAKLPTGTGKYVVDYAFQCGPQKVADAYLFNGVPINKQDYKISSGGAYLKNLDTNSPAEQRLRDRNAELQNKAVLLEQRLGELQTNHSSEQAKLAATLELANLYKQLQQFDKAETLYKSMLRVENSVADETALARVLADFADMYYVMGKYSDAEPIFERAVGIQSKVDTNHVSKKLLTDYAKTLYKLNKTAQGDEIYKRLRQSQ